MSIADLNARAVIVWRFSDGRRGHDNQSRGLIEALSALLPLEVHTIDTKAGSIGILSFLRRRFPAGNHLPTPQLIVGAGHATHWPMLAARRARGGRTVVLMKPSLPRSWFDLCLIPKHDGVEASANVLLTEGAINRVRRSNQLDATRGLILIGGISSHYEWSDENVLAQIRALIESTPHIEWTISDSPRTPASLSVEVREFVASCTHAKYFYYNEVDAEWLPAQFAKAGMIWVSEDSVSMLYEALSTGAKVGLLRLHARRASRVTAAVSALIADGRCLRVEDLNQDGRGAAAANPLCEAERCAKWIAQQWFGEIVSPTIDSTRKP